MINFRVLILIVLFFASLESFSQGNEKVEMADILRQDGKIYTVVIGLTVILTAMIILLIRVDRRLFRLEQKARKVD